MNGKYTQFSYPQMQHIRCPTNESRSGIIKQLSLGLILKMQHFFWSNNLSTETKWSKPVKIWQSSLPDQFVYKNAIYGACLSICACCVLPSIIPPFAFQNKIYLISCLSVIVLIIIIVIAVLIYKQLRPSNYR